MLSTPLDTFRYRKMAIALLSSHLYSESFATITQSAFLKFCDIY